MTASTEAAKPADALELIRLTRAEIGYGRPLLPPFDLTLLQGQRVAVLGPNGAGKSTLMRSAIGLLPLLGGTRTVQAGPALHVGYVPQAHRADPAFPLSALDVVVQGRFGRIGLWGFVRKADRERARRCLEHVGLGAVAHTPFRALSGGQRQRVLLARALAAEPDLLALDEFTSELDPAASAALMHEVAKLTQNGATTVVFVTHEISAAAMYATDVVLVDARRQVLDAGPAAELLTGERLTRLYGQPVTLERRGERVLVTVEGQ